MIHSHQIMKGAVLSAVVLLTACGGGSSGSSSGGGQGEAKQYDVEVRRSEHGIPHIKADNYASMGYGYGYVHAQDNICVLAEDLMTIRGERAQYLGRDGSYTIIPNGSTASNVDSDFFWRAVATDDAIAPIKANSDPEVVEATRGFVAGYNRYLRELKSGEHSGRHLACRDAAWLTEITVDDLYRRYFRLSILASSSVFVSEVANAAPPSPDNLPLPVSIPAISALDPSEMPLAGEQPFASNMYALGAEASTDESMLLVNPHFPWEGTERLYLAHMQLPDAEIMGASLYGVPAALIGFNQHVAWSHTVSTAYRFTFYELTLNPADPTQYFYEGELRDMEASEITVPILEGDGTLGSETRTLYRSHFGPMLELAVSGVPVLEWSPAKAYTLRDANAENNRLINQFFRWNRAQSYEEFVDLHGSVLGVPWVNTTATGPGKPAYYGDITVVPNVPDSKVQSCGAQPLQTALGALLPGLPILDGSRAACEWDTDPDAPAPGIFGPANLPSLERNDWVHNCNDSYWLSNPAQPLTGFAAIIGDEGAERTLRTRLCMLQVQRRLDGSDALPGNRFTPDLLQTVALDSAVYSAELGRQAVLDSYCQLPTLLGSSGPVDISQACSVLSAWDGKNNLDSVGGHIWREFWRGVNASSIPAALRWTTPFSADDPVNTPRGLNVLNPDIARAFADAVQALQSAGVSETAAIRDIQRSGVHEQEIPIFGGESFAGSFTIAGSEGDLQDGAYDVTYGNSYVQTVTWDAEGTPRAEGFITYSQSTDPASPYYQNMTEAYSAKNWIKFPWTEAEIAEKTVEVLRLSE
ncbi:penicillin acylase family protein [Spongiibacter marinus]|uniref:penicillin acylase family protein n=1 Tax=Spongiibacter marinus TaxID=354246 RepID=UPI00195FEA3A|nr:penicillin acylase family protein [Spongiibacter marinus]MBM7422090.1 acyl-homoserine-lactone acylase [Spongiibacter marinus]